MKAGPSRTPAQTSDSHIDVAVDSTLVIPKSPEGISAGQQVQAFREHLSSSFEPLESWPEHHALSTALARSHAVLSYSSPAQSDPADIFRLFLCTQSQQIRQAFRMLSAGSPIADVIVAITSPELFPSESKDLLPLVRDEVLRSIAAGRAFSSPREMALPEKGASPPPSSNGGRGVRISPSVDLRLIFSAFDIAFEKLMGDITSADFIRDAQSRSMSPALPEAYFGALRHSYGVMDDPLRVGRSIASDIRWTAISLFLTGCSSDAVAATILLHAANHFEPRDSEWLQNTASTLSARTAALVGMVCSSSPDPIKTPHEVSDLNFQRPARFRSPDAASDPEARAIACASMLSPAWLSCELGLDRVSAQTPEAQASVTPRLSSYLTKLLEFSSLMRDPSTPPEFAVRFQDRLEAFLPGRSGSGGAFSLDSSNPLSVRLTEMNSVLSVFKTLFSTTDDSFSQERIIRCMGFATELALRLLSKQAPLKALSEAFAHPCLDSIAPDDRDRAWRIAHEQTIEVAREASGIVIPDATDEAASVFSPHLEKRLFPMGRELGMPLSQATLAEAHRLIEVIAEQIGSFIPEDLRRSRQSLGFYSTLDDHRPDDALNGRPVLELLAQAKDAPLDASAWQAWLDKNRRELFTRLRQASLSSQSAAPSVPTSGEPDLGLFQASGAAPGCPTAEQVALLASHILLTNYPKTGDEVPEGHDPLSCLKGIKASSPEHAWQILVGILARDERMMATALGMKEEESVPLVPLDLYGAGDLAKMSRAISLMEELLLSGTLTKTPRNRAQGFRHVLEVGITLAMAGAHTDVVIAGILHDLYELSPSPLVSSWQARVRSEFGPDVDALVQLVTEQRDPDKGSSTPFLPRKMGIFDKVQSAMDDNPFLARRAAHVLLAAKISTLNEGILHVRERGVTQPWSQGTYTDNLQMMAATRQVADAICSKQDLLSGLFDRLLQKWITAARTGRAHAELGRQYLTGVEVAPDLAKGFQLARNAVELGASDAKCLLAWSYLEGKGTPRDSAKALTLFYEAAEEGFSEAYFYLGFMHQNDGFSLPQDYAEAARCFERAANAGHDQAFAHLGYLYLHGLGVAKDPEKAVSCFRAAAKLFIPYGAYSLAACLENGTGVKQDMSEALHWYLKAAKQDYPQALARLGAIYCHGLQGIKKDQGKAAIFLERSAALGDAGSQFSLGMLYHSGWGVPRDQLKALKLLSDAANQGYVLAHTNLGLIFLQGIGTPKDVSKAAHHFRIAAEGNSSIALNQLGFMHEMGNGVRKDLKRAVDMYCRAAFFGDAWALFRMGRCYAEGTGVKQDYLTADRLLRQAADKGNVEARDYRRTLMPQKSPSFIVRLMRRAAFALVEKIAATPESLTPQPPVALEAPRHSS